MKRPCSVDDRLRRRNGLRASGALALAVLLSSCVSQVTPKQTAQLYYDLGNAYSRLGEQDKATAAYLNALKLDSSLLEASYNLARVYIESGNVPKAITLLDGLLGEDPKNLIVLDTLGYAYYKQGNRTRALEYYDKVLSLSPTNQNALYNQGTIFAEEGRNREAIDTFTKLYHENSDSSLLLTLGKLEIAQGKLEEAVHYLEAYRTAKPDDFDGLKTLAEAYRKEKLYDKALGAYDAALAIKPDAADLLFAKSDILLTAIQDATNGMKALKAALDAGFNDHASIDALLANPELVDKQAVEALLVSKNLLRSPTSPGSTTPPSQKQTPSSAGSGG